MQHENMLLKNILNVKFFYLTQYSFCYMITQVIKMDEILKQTLLFDFYGELLTEHQKEIYSQVVLEDYSLSEIAKDSGISRQGVHDLIKRCNKTLEGYEEKLHLVERFWKTKEDVSKIRDLSLHYNKDCIAQTMEEINQISGRILEEL